MAPLSKLLPLPLPLPLPQPLTVRMIQVSKPSNPDGLVLESWGQGFVFGALTIMIFVTLCNIRRRILLHKLILLEVRSVQSTPWPTMSLT